MEKSSERRSSKRLLFPVTVKYILPDSSDGKVIANNISITGICLVLPQKLNVGTELMLAIPMPTRNRKAVIYGKVVWQKKSEGSIKEGYIIGISFVKADPLDIEEIITSVTSGHFFTSPKPPLS